MKGVEIGKNGDLKVFFSSCEQVDGDNFY